MPLHRGIHVLTNPCNAYWLSVAGASVNVKDAFSNTALSEAVMCGGWREGAGVPVEHRGGSLS